MSNAKMAHPNASCSFRFKRDLSFISLQVGKSEFYAVRRAACSRAPVFLMGVQFYIRDERGPNRVAG